jgi:hypothetical protein
MSVGLLNSYRFQVASGSYDPDVQAMLDGRLAVGGSTDPGIANAINDYVIELKSVSGLWDNIGQLVVWAGVSSADAGTVAIKGNNLTSNNFNILDYDPKLGVSSDGISKHFNTNHIYTDFGANRDSYHGYMRTTAGITSGFRMLFGHGTTENGVSAFNCNAQIRCRNNNSSSFTSPNRGAGGYGMNRKARSSFQIMFQDSQQTLGNTSQPQQYLGPPYLIFCRGTPAAPTSFAATTALVWSTGVAISDLTLYNTPTDNFISALNAI